MSPRPSPLRKKAAKKKPPKKKPAKKKPAASRRRAPTPIRKAAKRPKPKRVSRSAPTPIRKAAKRPKPKKKPAKKRLTQKELLSLIRKAEKLLGEAAKRERAQAAEIERLRSIANQLANAQVEKTEEAGEAELGDADGKSGNPIFQIPLKAEVHAHRPAVTLIRKWIQKRKHYAWWRNRDGSYAAVATFYGESAWAQLERAAERIPGPAIVSLRYLIPVTGAVRGGPGGGSRTSVSVVRLITPSEKDNATYWCHAATQIGKSENASLLYQFVPEDRHNRRAGLAVRWAPKSGWKPVRSPSRKPQKKGKKS